MSDDPFKKLLGTLDQLADLSKEVLVMTDHICWQPIESAPKDGTRILGYCVGDDDEPECAVLHWWVNETEEYVPASISGLFRIEKRKWEGMWIGAEYAPFHATHWMPLPKPPQKDHG